MIFKFEKTDTSTYLEVRDADLEETIAVCLYMVGTVYDRLNKADTAAAGVFKKLVIDGVVHPDSPLWKVDMPIHPHDAMSIVSMRVDADGLRRQMEAEQG